MCCWCDFHAIFRGRKTQRRKCLKLLHCLTMTARYGPFATYSRCTSVCFHFSLLHVPFFVSRRLVAAVLWNHSCLSFVHLSRIRLEKACHKLAHTYIKSSKSEWRCYRIVLLTLHIFAVVAAGENLLQELEACCQRTGRKLDGRRVAGNDRRSR